MYRLPFFATLQEAIAFIWHSRRDLVGFAYLPVTANTLINMALLLSLPNPRPTRADELLAALSPLSIALWAVAFVAAIGFYIVFAVAWHRRALLPGETTTIGAALRWHGRHWRFLGTSVLFFIALVLVVVVFGRIAGVVLDAIAGPGPGAGLVAAIVVTFIATTQLLRFAPVFPAIAVDDRSMTLGAAWRLTRGNGMTLFMLLFVTSLGVAVVHQIVHGLLSAGLGSFVADNSVLAIFVLVLIDQSLTFVAIAATTTIVSIAFRELAANAGGRSV